MCLTILKKMDTLTGKKLLTKDGLLKNAEEVITDKIKTVVFYFSANWVNARKSLIISLCKVYQENWKRNAAMEVIFVSSDNNEQDFKNEYFSNKHGPWYAVPFNDPIADELRYRYSVTSLPSIVVVRPSGEIVTIHGREDLEKLGLNVIVTWNE